MAEEVKLTELVGSGQHSQDEKERHSLLNRFVDASLGKESFQYWSVFSSVMMC